MFTRFSQIQDQDHQYRADKASTGGYERKIPQYMQKHENAQEADNETDPEREIVKILSKARSAYVVGLIDKGDEISKEDLEIVNEVQQHMIEEQKQVVEEQMTDNFICSLSKCYIEGCVVHTLLPTFIHYNSRGGGSCYASIESMDERTKKGYEAYMKNPNCSYIEVYERHICVVEYNGTTTVLNE